MRFPCNHTFDQSLRKLCSQDECGERCPSCYVREIQKFNRPPWLVISKFKTIESSISFSCKTDFQKLRFLLLIFRLHSWRTDVANAMGKICLNLSSSSQIKFMSSTYHDSRGIHAALRWLGRSRTARRCTSAPALVRVKRTQDSKSPWNAPDWLMKTVDI